jgi:hypothetical protein
MTPRSLFKIILKIFGLFFFREIIITVPQFISSIVLHFTNSGTVVEGVFRFAIQAIIILFYGFIIAQLLFNTTSILDKFKLDQGFDEEEFSFENESKKGKFFIGISASMVLTIALLVTAGVILVNEIPHLCKELFLYLAESRSLGNHDVSYIIIAIVKILIALLLIGERKRIVQFVEDSKSNNKQTDNEE